MLVKLTLRDDSNHEVWVNPNAVASIKRNVHTGEVQVTLVAGEVLHVTSEVEGYSGDHAVATAISGRLKQSHGGGP